MAPDFGTAPAAMDTIAAGWRTPAIADYDAVREAFSWDEAAAEIESPPAGGINIAYQAVDRHLATERADDVALRWLPKSGDPVDLTYAELAAATSRFANALTELTGGDATRVASLAGRVPELYIAALGTLKAGGVFTPLFAAFGPEPIRQRVDLGSIEVLVTTEALYRRKVVPIVAEMPTLSHVVLIDGPPDAPTPADGPTVVGFDELVTRQSDTYSIARTDPESLALLHFTSGTTGAPKGAMHVHAAVLAHQVTGRMALDLRPGDVYWCTADPGWVTGTTYGIISPLCNGVTSIIDEAAFDADRWYSVIEDHEVTVWYTAPTAVRMMMRAGADLALEHDLSSLRVIASVGEPLNPEAVRWGQEAFGQPILDNWWQTETGGIMISNLMGHEIRPGSMGRPLPGIDAAIIERDANGGILVGPDGEPVFVTEPDETGELALRRGWPSMLRGYLGQEERYARSFVGDWYCSGDLARRDADGYFWFVGRGDDVIKSSGHLIGPFEVESILIEHPAVSEAGVIGKPDPVAGDIVKAFVSLAPGYADDPELIRELMGFARKRLGAAVAPREIEVQERLPKTRSGKIMRRLLKARELGLPEGDTSTLEH
jgi:acetyl-CoA synthetase